MKSLFAWNTIFALLLLSTIAGCAMEAADTEEVGVRTSALNGTGNYHNCSP